MSWQQVMPRYVILFHEMPAGSDRSSHWDLMLECEGKLRTWALPSEPAQPLACDAEQLADHRLVYLEYEGPIAGERGSVTRWDDGHYRLEGATDDEFAVILRGRRLDARLTLQRKGDGSHFWRVSLSAAPTNG